jgi:hypothetical protein
MNPTTQKSILDFIAAHGHRPSQISKDPLERRLCYSMYRLIGTDNPQDSELRQTIDSLVPPKRRVKERKEWILEWCCVHGKRPGHSDAPQLYASMIRYITPKYKTFDPDFKANLDALCPSRREQQRARKVVRLETPNSAFCLI